MKNAKRRLFLFRTRFVLICTLLAVSIVGLDVSSRYGGRILATPLSDRTWAVVYSFDGLARCIWIHSTGDPIDVGPYSPNPDYNQIRVAKGDRESEKRLAKPDGSVFFGLDDVSGFWATRIAIGKRESVSDWGLIRHADLTKDLSVPGIAKAPPPLPPVNYDMLRFPLWPFAVLLFIPGFLRALQRVIQELRIPLHQCRICRYDLTGNTSGVCPECGTPVPGASQAAPRVTTSIDSQHSTVATSSVLPRNTEGGTGRILDANFNRAREALRVMEEYARFMLDDASLTETCKRLRHDLVEAIAVDHSSPPTRGGATSFVGARDIVGDVGCGIGVESEYRRKNVEEVVVAAGKRLSEALRVIEEYAKVSDPSLGAKVEQLRYRGYEIERRLAATMSARQHFGGVRLYVLLTESLCKQGWFETAQDALLGGADCIQLREKNLPDAELLIRAKRLAELCRKHGALFIVNDRADIALAAGANGVHLGQDDLPIAAIRRLLPPTMLVGVSTHTLEQARAAIAQAPDYIAVGPMFDSPTKPQSHIAGVDMLAQVRAMTGLPLVAIGGITPDNTLRILAAAQCAICVCQAVIAQPDVTEATRALHGAINNAHPRPEASQGTASTLTLPA